MTAATGKTHDRSVPFDSETGRALATTHGAYSPAAIQERAEDVHGRLLELFPELNSPRLVGSVKRYVDAVAKEQLATEALLKQHEEGKMSPRLLESANSATRLAQELADQLGLSVEGHAKLRRTAASTLEYEDELAERITDTVIAILDDLGVDLLDPDIRGRVLGHLRELDETIGWNVDSSREPVVVDAEVVPEKRRLFRRGSS